MMKVKLIDELKLEKKEEEKKNNNPATNSKLSEINQAIAAASARLADNGYAAP